jgi:hypothetical protein
MFGITTFMYLLSAAYWAYSVADAVAQMHEYIALAVDPFRARFDHTEVTKWSPLFNAITLINVSLLVRSMIFSNLTDSVCSERWSGGLESLDHLPSQSPDIFVDYDRLSGSNCPCVTPS